MTRRSEYSNDFNSQMVRLKESGKRRKEFLEELNIRSRRQTI